ncbi:polymorphic toxin type 44 domain-containing protein [Leucobacter insecticola]|uniref:polymorphic toxin type 44 domain-containing protein n=1 Tax=Leucobacter insecticola TaxID=2714934 RepID=UPI001FCBE12D|nr:polymorphic toxin type 44 domain-containing protein [Leucobacter insecticola]
MEGGKTILDKFATNAEWDMKPYLAEEFDYDLGYFYLRDEYGRIVRSDVFGNVVYGSMLAHWDVGLENALKGANMGSAPGVDAGVGDDDLDDRAVEFGYELYEKYPNGLTQDQYYEEIANANLSGT